MFKPALKQRKTAVIDDDESDIEPPPQEKKTPKSKDDEKEVSKAETILLTQNGADEKSSSVSAVEKDDTDSDDEPISGNLISIEDMYVLDPSITAILTSIAKTQELPLVSNSSMEKTFHIQLLLMLLKKSRALQVG